MKLPMLKNSDDKESASFTMLFLAFNAILLWLVLYISCPLFGITSIPAFDGASAMAFLAPLSALYFGRKRDEKSSNENNEEGNN